MVKMNGREIIVQELIEELDGMLRVLEEQEEIEPEFAMAREMADQLRQEIAALQE